MLKVLVFVIINFVVVVVVIFYYVGIFPVLF